MERHVYKIGYKGKPPPTKHTNGGLPYVVVIPTSIDNSWSFSDSPAKDDSEYFDMLHTSDLRTPTQRLESAVSPNSDSQEIGVQCFCDGRWPEKTDLKCWWCLSQFETKPFPCPMFKTQEGKYRIRGVFCGPSCAKAWAIKSCGLSNTSRIDSLINELAYKRGFLPPGQKSFYIPLAPPRETLNTFCGPDGLTIEQFRGMCAAGFDVEILHPPYITEKQVIVAECERMARISRHGRLVHVEDVDCLMMPASELAKRKREGQEIFAGVGAKRLRDFFKPDGSSTAKTTVHVKHEAQAGIPSKNGKIRYPLPPATPLAKWPKVCTTAKKVSTDKADVQSGGGGSDHDT